MFEQAFNNIDDVAHDKATVLALDGEKLTNIPIAFSFAT
jgi:hypothetical protein